MKKLMFAATAMLCGAVMAGDSDITSQNIVGYAGKQLDGDFGAKAVVAQFANVGASNKGFKLADIKPVAVDKVTADDLVNNITFQTLDNAGYTVEGSDRVWDGTKWTTLDGEDKSAEPYDPGTAVWMNNGSYNSEWECGIVNLQSSGEVIQENVIVDLDTDFGAVFVGNPFPVAIKLSDIIPYVESGTLLDDSVTFQKLDNAGYTAEDSDRSWNGTKWTTLGGEDMSTETLEPGEGIWVNNGNYDENWSCVPVKIRFVAPTF